MVEDGAVWLGCCRAAPRAGERRARLVERPALLSSRAAREALLLFTSACLALNSGAASGLCYLASWRQEALDLYRLQTTGADQEEQRQAVQAVQAAQGPASSAGPTCWRPRCSPSGGAVVLRLSSLHPQLHPQGQLQGRATDMFDLLKR